MIHHDSLFYTWLTHAQSSIIWYFLILNTFYLVMLALACYVIFSRHKKTASQRAEILLSTEALPSLDIIVPAYNEEHNILLAVQALINLGYRQKQIIVVIDGSTDQTLEILKVSFKLTYVHLAYLQTIPTKRVKCCYKSLIYDNLTIIEKENGGRADAINAGINACTSPYLLTIDADTIIDSEQMIRMLRHIFTQPHKCGFGASIRVANGCLTCATGLAQVHFPKTFLGGLQAIEYLRAFYLGRMGFESLGGGMIISGAFSFYETAIIRTLGGLDIKTLGEDMEIATHVRQYMYDHHLPTSIGYLPEPVCWTEVPEDWRSLGRQRIRWHIATMQVLWKYRSLFCNPHYGMLGCLVFPYFVFGEILAPFMEIIGYTVFLLPLCYTCSNWHPLVVFLITTWGFTCFMNLCCCLIETLSFRKYSTYKHLWKMIFYSMIENFGFRQAYLWWRLQACYLIFRPSKNWWSGWKKTGLKGSDINKQPKSL